MERMRERLRELLQELEQLRAQKHKHFDEVNSLVERVYTSFASFFPKYSVSKKGSRVVHHPNEPNIMPISIEREHGSRDHLPPRYAKYALDGIEDMLTLIESKLK